MLLLYRLLRRQMTRFPWMLQLFTFAVIGIVGLTIDAITLQAMLAFTGVDRYTGRIPSYVLSTSATWVLNRRFTFQHHLLVKNWHELLAEWFKFLIANLPGLVANFATYAFCVTFIPLGVHYPVLGLIPAAIVGLLFNFTVAKHFVFK